MNEDKKVAEQKRANRMLLALLVAILPIILGMFLLSSSFDRGRPSMAILTKAGCEVARLAGAQQEVRDRTDTCSVRGYVRESVFSGGVRIDQGNDLRFYLGEGQIAGHFDDASFEAPAGKDQIRQRWIGLGIVIASFLGLALAYLLPAKSD